MNNLNQQTCNVYEWDYIAANPILLEKINTVLE